MRGQTSPSSPRAALRCISMHLPRVCCLCQGVCRAWGARPCSSNQHKPAGVLDGTQHIRQGLVLLHGPLERPMAGAGGHSTEGLIAPPNIPARLVPRDCMEPQGRWGRPGAEKVLGGHVCPSAWPCAQLSVLFWVQSSSDVDLRLKSRAALTEQTQGKDGAGCKTLQGLGFLLLLRSPWCCMWSVHLGRTVVQE